jgi:hypothetical protein
MRLHVVNKAIGRRGRPGTTVTMEPFRALCGCMSYVVPFACNNCVEVRRSEARRTNDGMCHITSGLNKPSAFRFPPPSHNNNLRPLYSGLVSSAVSMPLSIVGVSSILDIAKHSRMSFEAFNTICGLLHSCPVASTRRGPRNGTALQGPVNLRISVPIMEACRRHTRGCPRALSRRRS